MANIERLQASMEKASDKVTKCKKTIERHEKQLEKKLKAIAKHGITLDNMNEFKWKPEGGGSEYYWEICDIERKLDDIKGANRKLSDAKRILENWVEKLEAEKAKDKTIANEVPQVIIDFVQQWYENTLQWYIQKYEKFPEYKAKIQNRDDLTYKEKAQYIQAFGGALLLQMDSYRDVQEREDFLVRTLQTEKKARILDLKNRIEGYVGKITDARGLHMSGGNINGVIEGEDGIVRVETIGAGGWNIQCFHYRVLINRLK